MPHAPNENDDKPRGLPADVGARARETRDRDELEHRQESLIARLRTEAAVHARDLAALREHLEAVEHELEDLRAIRDALTPPELPQRPGLELAAAFLPAVAEHVSGDFYLVAQGPLDSTVLVVGDVVGHGVQAGTPRGVHPDDVRRDRPVLGRSLPAAELGEHRADGARGHQQ